MGTVKYDVSLLTEYDIYLFKEGKHFALHEKMGSRLLTHNGEQGTFFAVWAPGAADVSVMGEFNSWQKGAHPLRARADGSGIWEGFIPGVGAGEIYKYHIVSRHRNYRVDKGDPYAFFWETPPSTSSIVWDLAYDWHDEEWMKTRSIRNAATAPMSIYEIHAGSWRRVPEEGNRSLNYRELAHYLADYVKEMGFTHVEFMPVMTHPFYGSWGYQTVGYYSIDGRYGTPQDFMYLVDHLHANGIGVIMDWVPSHFPGDEHGLVYFDGTHLFEYADMKKGFHPEWNSYIFDYSRNEVRNFLISNALFWLGMYHIDGLRVDAVASMLYLDYARKPGQWVPNIHGGKENIEAIAFLRDLNSAVYENYPDVQTIAEESTDWPMVSRPVYAGGLGFGMKWNMGWMHDTIDYFSKDSVFRKYHHDRLTFSIWYAFSENYVLPLSHDEVVYGKGSLIGKMPGDEWQRNANLRLLFGYMFGHPGKKLLFMGDEVAQWSEWNHDSSIEWDVLQYASHEGVRKWVRDLNSVYTTEAALYELDFSPEGFRWMDFRDWEQSIISFVRKSGTTEEMVLVVCNFTPVPRLNYRVGVPRRGFWREILNSDAKIYGGSGHGNFGGKDAAPVAAQGVYNSLSLTIPPLGALFLKNEGDAV